MMYNPCLPSMLVLSCLLFSLVVASSSDLLSTHCEASRHADADVAIFFQHSVRNQVFASPDQAANHKPPAPMKQDTVNEVLHKMAAGLPSPAGLPQAVPDPGLDDWDAFDTVLILAMIVVLLVFDMCFIPRADSIRGHVASLAFMLCASAVFCAIVWVQRGEDDGIAWATGYVVEWALSLDNLFMFHLVFKAFSVPHDQTTRALTFGIYGAIGFRLVFILCLTQLFKLCYAVDVIVGGLLIVSGILSLRDDDEEEVQDLATVRFFKWLFGTRLRDSYSEEPRCFTTGKSGEFQVTVLFLVVCVVAVVDCIFAVDSVGSKTGQIKNVYINLTSCLMAMFSLRSLFFIIKDMADLFDYVKYGICAILCFVGTEMMVSKWFHVSLGWMCCVICVLFGLPVIAAVIKGTRGANTKDMEHAVEDAAVASPRVPLRLAGKC